jgi:hypothetical protein
MTVTGGATTADELYIMGEYIEPPPPSLLHCIPHPSPTAVPTPSFRHEVAPQHRSMYVSVSSKLTDSGRCSARSGDARRRQASKPFLKHLASIPKGRKH